ncbi:MAG TPA: methyltransferase domain-containing protein [Bacteroidetes bacterium]|nr:methyltransferase domain-containing protein [Bacteroidota bacterium]
MANQWFRFKQFTVWQDQAAMKVTTDGVLLGAWVRVDPTMTRVLDVGTGTGLLALMISQRCCVAVDAVEIDPLSAEQARENISRSPWPERIRIVEGSFQEYVSFTENRYDLVVSNPPYFSGCLKSSSPAKARARHTDNLSPEDLLDGTLKVLKPAGRLAVILPAVQAGAFEFLARDRHLYVIRQCEVVPVKDGKPGRMLFEFSLQPRKREKETLVIRAGDYTPEYLRLTGEFYLKFQGLFW